MTKLVMLTTVDNPHSPFDEFAAWYTYDLQQGYRTSELLARILHDSDQLVEADRKVALEQAIDEVIKENVTGMYRKIEIELSNEEEIPIELE